MEEKTLHRSLSWVQGTALTISAVLGCGILVLPSLTAASAGPASLFSWVLMSLLAFPIVLTMVRLARIIPDAGGITAYVRAAFGPHSSAILSWIMLGSVPIGAPAVALTAALYVNDILPLSTWGTIGIAASILSLSLFLHTRGIEASAKINVIVIIAILALLVTAIFIAAPYVKMTAFHPFAPNGWLSAGTASVVIFFSFVGWEMIPPLSEEFINPKRDVPISLILGAVCISLLYVAVSFVTIGTHSYGGNSVASLSLLISKGLGVSGSFVTAVLALFIAFSTVHANIAGFSRMVYAQARKGDFPAFFAILHAEKRTPVSVLLGLGAAFAVVFILYGICKPGLSIVLQGPSTVFIVSYIFTMLAGLKITKPLTFGWFMAFISLLTSVTILFFSGWTILYPILLAGIGELFLRAGKRTAKNTL